MCRTSAAARFSARVAPSRRPPGRRGCRGRCRRAARRGRGDPAVDASPPAPSRRKAGALLRGRSAQTFAFGACRGRSNRHRRVSSKRSQSERVAAKSERSAGLSEDRRVAGRREKDGERVTRFGQADLEAIVAQRARKSGEPSSRAVADALNGSADRQQQASGCSLRRPCPEAGQSPRVLRRVRSSWVLSRQIIVSCTASGSCRRSWTPRPASVAAQSSVSATPGTLRRSSLRTAVDHPRDL